MTLKSLKDNLWKILITYRTERQVVVENVKIGLLHKATLVGVFIYLLVSIITDHAYMKKEAPAVSINSWNGAGEASAKWAAYRNGNAPAPWYCNNSATEYVYSPGFTYFENQCDFNASMGHIYNEGGNSVSFVTYYQDTPLEDKGSALNAFIPGDANVPTTVQSQDGNDQKKFEKDEVISVSIGDLFRMAGIQPDDRNPDSGGQAPKGNMDWPLWRMTGVSFMMEMEYKNFRNERPFDFSTELVITVSAAERVWTSRGQRVLMKRVDGELAQFQRYVQVMSVSFLPSGNLGKPDAFTAVMNIAVGIAIFGVTKVIVDMIGKWILEEFYQKKMFDAEQWDTIQNASIELQNVNKTRVLSAKAEEDDGKTSARENPMLV